MNRTVFMGDSLPYQRMRARADRLLDRSQFAWLASRAIPLAVHEMNIGQVERLRCVVFDDEGNPVVFTSVWPSI